jgi:hypothetical protein
MNQKLERVTNKLETVTNKLNTLKDRHQNTLKNSPQATASKYTKFNTKYMHRKELVDILFNILFNKSDVTNTK